MYGLKILLDALSVGGTAGVPAGPIQTVQGVEDGEPIAITTPSGGPVVTVARTADTALYAANDVIGIDNAGSPGAAALTFLGLGSADGGETYISSSSLRIDVNAVPSGMTSFRLYFYNVTPPSAKVDNDAWDLPSGDRASFLGYLDLGTPVDLGATLYVKTDGQNVPITVPPGGTVFAYLVTIGTWTPASGTVFTITLHSLST